MDRFQDIISKRERDSDKRSTFMVLHPRSPRLQQMTRADELSLKERGIELVITDRIGRLEEREERVKPVIPPKRT